MRLSWDNGDRTVLVKSELGGITLGWNLLHTAQDELFAAIEGTALHTRIVLDRMAEYGVPIERVINAGGIPQHNAKLNQVYADVLNKEVLVPDSVPTSIGSGIFAQLAAGIFKRRNGRCVRGTGAMFRMRGARRSMSGCTSFTGRYILLSARKAMRLAGFQIL
jgi:ribulose kinase